MAFLSKKEFCDLYLIKSKDLSNYIKRGNVIADEQGFINTDEDKNRLFISKRHAKMDNVLADPEVTGDTARSRGRMRELMDGDNEDMEEETGLMSMTKSERHYKHHLAVKTERAAELDRLKIEKIRGEVIPSDLMPPVILQHNQSFVTAFKQVADQILTDYAKMKDFTVEEIAQMRDKMLYAINDGAKKAKDQSLKAVAVVVQNYSIKRGAGERA